MHLPLSIQSSPNLIYAHLIVLNSNKLMLWIQIIWDSLDELSAKLGTLEILLDSLERNKHRPAENKPNIDESSVDYSPPDSDGGICFNPTNYTYEQDSLEDSMTSSYDTNSDSEDSDDSGKYSFKL